jgi:hypothetical protein
LLFFIVPTIRTLRRDQLSSLSGCPLIELLTTVDFHGTLRAGLHELMRRLFDVVTVNNIL